MIDRVGYVDEPLTDWQVAAATPGAVADPAALAGAPLAWTACTVPTTAAAALRAAGAWSLDGPVRRFDDDDWWWRTRFRATAGEAAVLCLDGVATIADVWLNGEVIATIDGMFTAHRVPVRLAADNELVIACRSLTAALAARRPRPRWRAPMVEHQQLRWFRTTLLGHTPGWSPPAAAVGPWRPVRLERATRWSISDLELTPRLDGDTGVLDVTCRSIGPATVVLVVEDADPDADREVRAVMRTTDDGALAGRVEIPDVKKWWPVSHGTASTYAVHLVVDGHELHVGAVGFRDLEIDTSDGGFAVRINGVPVFCRGGSWTPPDPVALSAPHAAYQDAVVAIAMANLNMIRISGAMIDADDALLECADHYGVLVWHDLMFANMDYPADDPAFARAATAEVDQLLRRLRGHPSVIVVCGNSEVSQQAAMWGAGREHWEPPLFHTAFAELARARCPTASYWPSSAHGGEVPFRADVGTTSYYGVGAYLRSLDDARRSGVRFATECLAFANVPDPACPAPPERTPRDTGASWDFADVRDHYFRTVFGIEPGVVRAPDPDRYRELARVVTGEIMAHALGEWRRPGSRCAGALIWFLRDLWPCDGWGIFDARGRPKPAAYAVKRAMADLAVHISDEGTSGLRVAITNDLIRDQSAVLELSLWRDGNPCGVGRTAVEVPARGAIEVPALAAFDGFLDLNHAYRFGQPTCDLVAAALVIGDVVRARAFHFPLGMPSARDPELGLTVEVTPTPVGGYQLAVGARRTAIAVAIDLPGYDLEDNHFHLAPGTSRRVECLPDDRAAPAPCRGSVTALNATSTIELRRP